MATPSDPAASCTASACTASCWFASRADPLTPGPRHRISKGDPTVTVGYPMSDDRRRHRARYREVVSRAVFTSSVLGPHERGVELGERFAAQVIETVARYRRLFERRAGSDFDVALSSERAWQAIRPYAPTHAEEIAGIAEGSGVPVEQVAAVNARTEILVAATPTGLTECSTVVSSPAGRPPVAVQTWDWY